MENTKMQLLLVQALARLVGCECWGIACGYGTGSRVLFSIGKKIKLDKPIQNEHLSDDMRNYDSEFSLFVKNSAWRLERQSEIICTSNSDNKKNQEMQVGLSMVVGSRIMSAQLIGDFFDLIVAFDNGCVLRTFTSSVEEYGGEYSVSTLRYILSVEPRARLDYFEKRA